MNEEFLPKKRMACFTTIGGYRVIALSAMIDGTLAILKMEELKGPFRSWKSDFIEKMKTYKKEGLSILIEAEDFDYFSLHGDVFMLDDIDDIERRTLQSIALDKYYALTQMGDSKGDTRGNLKLVKELQRHWITDSTVNVRFDDRGRRIYQVEQDSFTSHQRAILLSVLAATHFNEYNEAAMQEMLGHIGIEIPDKTPMQRARSIFKGV